ncbi:hypothetical protein D9M69_537800 [compost metagenome]
MAGDAEALAPVIAASGHRLRRVCAHVRAALLLGHAHAHGHAGLVFPELERWVVGAAGELRRPVGVDGGVVAQRGRDPVAHGDGAQHGRFQLGEEHEAGGAGQVWTRCTLTPRRAMQPRRRRSRHQRVVARMKLHLVDAVPKTVVALELRREHIGEPRVGLHLGAAQRRAQRMQVGRVQRGRVELQCRTERLISSKQVVVNQRFHLIEHFMGSTHENSSNRSGVLNPGRRGTGFAGPPAPPP